MTHNKLSVSEQLPVSTLRSSLNGRLITPEDPRFDEARTVFYGGIDHKPALIVRAADLADITQVLRLARERGMELAVRSGGHSFAGHSVSEGGIVLDLKDMKALQIDAENHTVWAEAGLTAGELTHAIGAHGLAIGFGDTGSVGIGGITLGGGVGFLARKYGLTIDNLLAADVVTADGALLRVDGERHPDIFWAIRGGGGNFGVATRFQFRLNEVDSFVGGVLILPATPGVIASFMAEAEAAPEELSTIANIMPAPPMPFVPQEIHGQMVVMAIMAYAGPVDAGLRVIERFRKLAPPVADLVRPMQYPEIYFPEEGDHHPTAAARSLFMDAFDLHTAEMIVDHLQNSTAQMAVAQLRGLGGAVDRVPVDATAYAHRGRKIMVNVFAMYAHPDEASKHEAWVSSVAAELQQGEPGVYVNFLGNEGAERVRQAYPGSTWDRLREIKARYDPTNLFRLNHNIPGAES